MAVFNIGFSEGKVSTQPTRVEAPTIEEALEAAWQKSAAGMERADATALGAGIAYRFTRRGGHWQQLASHPVPGFEP